MDILIFNFLLLATLGMLAMAFVVGRRQSRLVEARLGSLSVLDARRDEILRKMTKEESFRDRIVFPAAQRIYEAIQTVIPGNARSWVQRNMIHAGLTKSYYAKVFFGVQILIALTIFVVMNGLTLLGGKPITLSGLFMSTMVSCLGFMLPVMWLARKARLRKTGIKKSLAPFLELLVICVEAGLGLDIAIKKIAEQDSAQTSVYLREELNRYIADLNLGKPRRQALLDLSERTGVDDFKMVINAMVQAYDMGASIANTLRVQAETLRDKRMQAAEERAAKIPVKMVPPIYLFFFPAIFLMVFGPLGVVVIKNLSAIATGSGGMMGAE